MPDPAAPTPLHPWVAAGVVALSSAAVLVLEVVSVRLVAPYVGLTLETYTAAIGVALAAIATGAAAGGTVADASRPGRSPRRLLGPLLLAGAGLTLLARPVVVLVGPGTGGGPFSAVVLVGLAVAPAVAVLSAVPPVVVKLQLTRLERSGSVVGRLSAISTVGALVGTFLTGFVLLAVLPTSVILLLAAAVLGLVGVGLTVTRRRTAALAVVAGVAVGGLGALVSAVADRCDLESRYYCVRLEVDDANPSGRTLFLDDLRHSYVDLDDPEHLEFAYARRIADVLDAHADTTAAGRPLDVLYLGAGGLTLPRYFAATRPGSTATVLEIDPRVVEVNRERLGLDAVPGVTVRIGDGRVLLADEPSGAYDAVVGDAFGSLSVPWHLTTREHTEEIRRVLRPGGVYALNVIDYRPNAFVQAETATVAAVFAEAAVLADPADLEPAADGLVGIGGNWVVVGSDAPLPVEVYEADAAARGEGGGVLVGAELDRFLGDAEVLVDDEAPVDQLLTPYVVG